MFFKKHIKPEKLLADIEDLKGDINCLSEKVKKIDSEIEGLRRIVKNHSHNEITGYTENFFPEFGLACINYHGIKSVLHVFKNGEEYTFEGLSVEKPVFTQGEEEHIVYVESECNSNKFVLDLYRNTWILISYGKDEDKN